MTVEATVIPIYMNWEFWTVTLSFIAILLSQLPPIHLILRPKKLEVEVHSRVGVTHAVGNANINMVVSIRNTGGRTLRIKKLRLSVRREGSLITTVKSINYFESQSSTHPVIFIPFSLKPEDSWTHNVSFFNEFDRQTEKQFRDSTYAVNANISEKVAAQQTFGPNKIGADPELVQPLTQLFNKLFIWQPGEYILNLEVDAEPGSASYSKQYRFTLYESDTKELVEHTQDYMYGQNIIRPSLWVPLSEHVG